MLEYDDDRSGSFDPLRDLPDDKEVVLGLVTTKSPRPGGRPRYRGPRPRRCAAVPARPVGREPAVRVPGTSVVGNRLTIDEQNAKLRVVVEAARKVWG